MFKIVEKQMLIVFITLFSLFYSISLMAEDITGIISRSRNGGFELKKENGELIWIATGGRVTKFFPDNYVPLSEDKVKVTYDIESGRGGSSKYVAKRVESIIKSSNQLGDIVCEITETGMMLMKVKLIDRPLQTTLAIGSRDHFPKRYKPEAGDVVAMYAKNEPRGDLFEIRLNKYFTIEEIKQVDDVEKERYLKNSRKRQELWESPNASHVDELAIDINSITYTGLRNAAREIIKHGYYNNKKLTDEIEKTIKRYLENPDNSDIGIEAISISCFVLNKSMNKDYIPVLQEVLSSGANGTIKKHAKKALSVLKKI
ncbi:MAG: hypothetical protein JXL81_02495 [Deltaproteobacteria bacterium]|nr:hypothetical protein [Deltaproteobacteria bacterium]